MLSINTNLSSIIAQNSMRESTNALNQAIERMSTGFKINHAKDNAANYSITTNMTTKIGAYQIAEDNAAMGLDMLTTATGGLELISNKLSRLRDLAIQSANDTYGSDSQNTINVEAKSIVDEVKRVYNTSEYNGKKLFMEELNSVAGLTTPTYLAQDVANMTTLTKAIEESSLTTGGEYSISSAEELAKLAEIVNNGTDTSGMTFVLANDIDLAQWCAEHADTGGWVAIGENSSKAFKGTFDGNGHIIDNLTIDKESADYQGLFGYTYKATIKNVGLENADVHGNAYVGSLVGRNSDNTTITNCYATGHVLGEAGSVGGLIGSFSSGTITNCYANVDTSGSDYYVGGLIGFTAASSITNCYANGDVNNSVIQTGGLVGRSDGGVIISNCYATGNVYSQGNECGGLVGRNFSSTIINSYATGNVYSEGASTGGLVGLMTQSSTITSCYATGDVFGKLDQVGGLVGLNSNYSTITSCYATGDVYGNTIQVGGGCGMQTNNAQVADCYALGSVKGENQVGGFLGYMSSSTTMSNCASIDSTVIGSGKVGDLLTIEEIQAKYTDETMGFTEENGWVIINGQQYIKGMVPAGVLQDTSLQIGVDSSSNSQIAFNMGFSIDDINILSNIGKKLDKDYLSIIDNMLETVSAKQTSFGSVQNRLESVLDEIVITRDNLISSHSTLKDADISKVSSEYIKHQILQQASATLMATANQSPSIALQLI